MSISEIALRGRQATLGWVDRVALRDVAPILVGLAPFAMVLGIAMSEAGISPGAGTLGSLLLWAGSAQLAAIGLMDSGAGLFGILAAVVAINARLLIYGAALEPMFRAQPRWFRWLGPHFLIDQNYVLATSRAELREPDRFRRYWITTAAALGAVWLSTIGLTMGFGALLSADSPLSFGSICVLVGLLVPKLTNRRARHAALAASLTAAAGSFLPHGIGLVLGIAVGALVPTLLEGRSR